MTTKFKVSRCILPLMLLCLFLCACHADNANTTLEQNSSTAYPAPVQLYLQMIADEGMEEKAFALIYLDDDDIPELVICDRYYGEYSVYTIKDGSLECLIDSVTTVEMSYFERKNIVSMFSRWNGGGDEGGYANEYYQLDQYSEILTVHSIPSFEFYYNAVYDENGEWTGDSITEYYEKGKKIDETTYNQIIVDLDISQDDEISCFSEGGLHFTKDELVTYLTEMAQ